VIALVTLGIHLDKTESIIGIAIGVILGILVLWKKQFARRAQAWPVTLSKVENVFLDASSRGPNRRDETHTVLAYAYSVDDAYYSGQIILSAGEASLESIEKALVGREISIHYNPTRPEVSIFLEHEVGGHLVVSDRRISMSSWLGLY
jgi:hypothetical protein